VGFWKSTGFANQINKSDLETVIMRLYKSFPADVSSIYNATQQQTRPLKKRMEDNSTAEDTILTDVRSCGILVNDQTRIDYLKFAHKSFLEYLVSFYFVECIVQDKSDYHLMANSVSAALEDSINSFIHSQETIAFTSEILIQKLDLSDELDKKVICKNLFKLLYPVNTLKSTPWLAGIFELFFLSRLSLLLFPICLVLLEFGIIQYKFISSIKIFGLTILLLITFISFNYLLLNKYIRRRANIWLKCCEQLNINQDIIFTVIPKAYFNFIKDDRKVPFILRRVKHFDR
jgi:hypothetical protein